MPMDMHARVGSWEVVDESVAEVAPVTEVTELEYYRPLKAKRNDEVVIAESAAPIEAMTAVDAADGSFNREALIYEVVLGEDDRVKVDPVSMGASPWRQICALRIQAATGRHYVGTGWFIAPNVLATAGHCVYMLKEGGWAKSIKVAPGLNGDEDHPPFGWITAERFASVHGWVQAHSRDYDYGVILLPESGSRLGRRLGNFSVRALPDAALKGANARISGYPADRERARFQYYHERPVLGVSETRLDYDHDTYGGQSGSPIWQNTDRAGRVAVGIHTNGSTAGNSGTRISQPVLHNLMAWIKEHPSGK